MPRWIAGKEGRNYHGSLNQPDAEKGPDEEISVLNSIL